MKQRRVAIEIGSLKCVYTENAFLSEVDLKFKAGGEVHNVKLTRDEAEDLAYIIKRAFDLQLGGNSAY